MGLGSFIRGLFTREAAEEAEPPGTKRQMIVAELLARADQGGRVPRGTYSAVAAETGASYTHVWKTARDVGVVVDG